VLADGRRSEANGTRGLTRNTSADVSLSGGAPDNVTVASCCSALLPVAALTSAVVADGGLEAGPQPASVHPYIRSGLPCSYSVPLRVVPRSPPSGAVQGLDVVYVGESSVTLAWTPVNGADRYQVMENDVNVVYVHCNGESGILISSAVPLTVGVLAQVLVAESLDGATWVQPFVVPRGTGSRVDRPRATVTFESVHLVRTRCHL
jgi:hypothetical protein